MRCDTILITHCAKCMLLFYNRQILFCCGYKTTINHNSPKLWEIKLGFLKYVPTTANNKWPGHHTAKRTPQRSLSAHFNLIIVIANFSGEFLSHMGAPSIKDDSSLQSECYLGFLIIISDTTAAVVQGANVPRAHIYSI